MRSGRREGNFPLWIASRACSRRIGSSGTGRSPGGTYRARHMVRQADSLGEPITHSSDGRNDAVMKSANRTWLRTWRSPTRYSMAGEVGVSRCRLCRRPAARIQVRLPSGRVQSSRRKAHKPLRSRVLRVCGSEVAPAGGQYESLRGRYLEVSARRA